ncbi:MAG TPA: hypothetical protein VGO60_18730, partial [Iamia sp.]|nr:hypothetical protein [Iamia sp.]
MKQFKSGWKFAVLAVIAGVLAAGLGGSPASADPAWVTRAPNTLSNEYQLNGCQYKVRYGGFGSIAYAQVRIYNPTTACANAGVTLKYADGSGNHDLTEYFSAGYTTGTDGCGSYREAQATSPGSAYALGVVAVIPGVEFAGRRYYGADGLNSQTVYAY